MQILGHAEELLRRREPEAAFEECNRCCRSLEKNPEPRRGELEVLCLALAQRARCCLIREDYLMVVDDCKRFGRIYEEVLESGNPDLLHEREKVLLGPATTAIGHLTVLGAAAEIAVQCRDRVGAGFAPKVVRDHAMKAIVGLKSLDKAAFPGLDSLRAHICISRAQAALELEKWEEAREDSLAALAYNPDFREAQYMLQAAERQEW